jgi:hypothetical protein
MESMEFFNVATLNQLDSMSLSLEILNSSDYEQSVLDINSHFIWPLKLIISYTLYVIDNYNKFEFLNILIKEFKQNRILSAFTSCLRLNWFRS